MKIYSEKIGPVEYFRFIGFVCFAIPYGWSIPKYWPVCALFTVGAWWSLGRIVKKEDQALRAAKSDDPKIAKVVVLFGVLVMANAGLTQS